MKTLYFDCFAGISGDMALGALLDLGIPLEEITKGLRKLPVRGYEIREERAKRGGITGTRVIVSLARGHRKHRTYADIARMIRRSSLSRKVKDMSLRVFQELARAESRIHGVPTARVEFHEVGGVDSIADIVGTCLGLEFLRVQRIRSSPLPWFRGWVESHAGHFPLPAPAAAELMKGVPIIPTRNFPSPRAPGEAGLGEAGAPCRGSMQGEREGDRELVTPTGIAILKGVAEGFGNIPSMTLKGIGYGAGAGNQDFPNLLRVVMGTEEREEGGVVLVETNIDDMNPQLYEPLMERLFHEGALDVYLTPVHMKKGRPGVLLTAVAREEDRDRIAGAVFSESTSIGLRWFRVNRYTAEREYISVKLKGGSVRGKVSRGPWGRMFTPEYEDMKHLAQKTGRPVKDIYIEALSSCRHISPSPHRGEVRVQTRQRRVPPRSMQGEVRGRR